MRPYDLQPDNSVSSEKVADARIVYSGKGTIADFERAGLAVALLQHACLPL